MLLFKEGKIDDERFRSLARGVYGQRQEGVQMIRLITIWKSNE
jgi:sulfite reductase (ferredoxin)